MCIALCVGNYQSHKSADNAYLLSLTCLRCAYTHPQVQEITPEAGSPLAEAITTINACFPEEIVKYYSPGFSETLLDRVDTYSVNLTASAKSNK